MKAAVRQAEKGIANGHGGPFGCVIVKDDKIIGRGHNQVLKKNNPTLHGEMVALASASRHLGTYDLSDCDMYTTGEPCPMCLGATMWANIRNIYYGCSVKDTEKIGFRDCKFDKVMTIDRARLTNLFQIDQEACLELYKKYNKIKGRIIY